MKKTIFLSFLFALATAFALDAQTTKGSVCLSLHNFSPLIPEAGGILANSNALGIAFSTLKSEVDGVESPVKTKFSTIGLSGSAHYFIIDNLSAGINLNFLNHKEKEDGGGSGNNDEYVTTIFMAGPELRYYFPASAKAKIWVGGGGSFGSVKNKLNGKSDDNPNKLSRFSGGVGVAFFPNAHFSVDLGLGYGVFTSKYEFDDFGGGTTKYKDTNSGLILDLGFSIFL